MLRLVNITKRFGETRALSSLNIEVKTGELFTLLGPSGCGKSTAIRIVAGLETADEGQVFWNDADWSSVPPQRRNVAMVFQHYALYPHRSVRGNIEYPLKRAKMDAAGRRQRVDAVATMLGLTPLLDRRPRNLSGGEAQRVALARALVREPACFLLDEPLSNLDARLRSTARAEFRKIQRSLNVTTIYVTHDQEEALSLGDRVGIMNRGRIEQVGEPEDLLLRPANAFVAGFIGRPPMNLLPATVAPADNGQSRVTLGRPVTSPSPPGGRGEGASRGGEVTVGIRAEDVRIWRSGDHAGSGTSTTRGNVVLVERAYPDYIAHCETEFGLVRVKTAERPSEGSVELILPMGMAHYFSLDTGLAMAPPKLNPYPPTI